MKKLYTIISLFAFSLFISAQGITVGKTTVDEGIAAFLKTKVGKHFTAQEVMSVYGKSPATVLNESGITGRENVLTETFSKLTAGSEDAPDDVNIGDLPQEEVDALLDNPGWTAYRTYAAGGCAYLGLNPEDSSDPGYLMTPNHDTTDGIYVIRLKVRNVNPNAQNYPLQYFVLDNTDGEEHMISANAISINDKWSTVEFEIGQCTAVTTVMFFSWAGKILVDDVVMDKVTYALESTDNIKCKLTDINHVSLSWDAVSGASSYRVRLMTSYREVLKELTASSNSTDADVEFDPTEGLMVEVTAIGSEGESHPTVNYFESLAPSSLAAPVAKDATNISHNGFTLNWEKVALAYSYEIHSRYSHTAQADGEEYYYMNDDFSEVTAEFDTPEATVMNNGRLTSLDDYINTPGWSVYLATVSTGMIGITNVYDILPPVLVGPADNYSLGNGKVSISGSGMSVTDDCIVTVGFAKKASLTGKYDFIKGTTKTIEFAPNDLQPFNVDLEGGTDGAHIMFKITDASKDGDMALFAGPLQIKTALNAGESYVQDRPVIRVPYTESSCDVALPFCDGDEYEYSVVAAFADVKSAESNVVKVTYVPDAISTVEAENSGAVQYYSIDGRQLGNAAPGRGMYIARQGNKAKVVRK